MNNRNTPFQIEDKVRSALAVPDANPSFVNRLEVRLLQHKKPRRPSLFVRIAHAPAWHAAALVGLALVILVLALFSFPQGRAWASSLYQFFLKTEGNSLPAPTAAPITLYEVTQGVPVPSQTPKVHQEPFYGTCRAVADPICSVSQIQAMVDFPIRQLSKIPPDYSFMGATGGPDWVVLVYQKAFRTGTILLYIGRQTGMLTQLAPVSSNAVIEKVRVTGDDVEGEYVEGIWESGDGRDSEWNADPRSMRRLRWQEGELLYTLIVSGETTAQAQLSGKAELLTMASQLTSQPPTAQTGSLSAFSLEDAQKLVTFDLKIPQWLPKGYTFHSARIDKSRQSVCLTYSNGQDELTTDALYIFESAILPLPDPAMIGNLQDGVTQTTTLPIAGADDSQGQHLDGNLFEQALCNRPGMAGQALFWRSREITHILYANDMDFLIGLRLSKVKMQRIAEGLTGVTTITDDTIDPERLTSIELTEKLVGYALPKPLKLPAGEEFQYAVFNPQEQEHGVAIFFTHFSLSVRPGVPEGADPQWEKADGDRLEVRGKPAHYGYGCYVIGGWDPKCGGPHVLTWRENGFEFQLSGSFNGDNRENREILVAIAENLSLTNK